jgi:dihydroorotate dehydrogenase
VKISPDMEEHQLYELVDVLMTHSVSGVIATNTTVDLPKWLRHPRAFEPGGLSGRPLTDCSTHVIRSIFQRTRGALPIIGVGGIFTAADALAKIQAGASLVQVYTGLVYEGPGVALAINRGLLQFMDQHGVRSIQDLVGQESREHVAAR